MLVSKEGDGREEDPRGVREKKKHAPQEGGALDRLLRTNVEELQKGKGWGVKEEKGGGEKSFSRWK